MTIMRVIAKGKKGKMVYDMVDRYDEKESVTSMGKTTGYTASIIAQMVGAGEIHERGVVAAERAVVGNRVDALLSELNRRGVQINVEN
jgi:lysine 6-dehydrogenase